MVWAFSQPSSPPNLRRIPHCALYRTPCGGNLSTGAHAGGCDVDYRAHPYFLHDNETTYANICPAVPKSFNSEGLPLPNLPAAGANYQCTGGHKLHGAATWLGIAGLAIMVILMSRGFRGAIIVGVLFATIIAWIPGACANHSAMQSPCTASSAE